MKFNRSDHYLEELQKIQYGFVLFASSKESQKYFDTLSKKLKVTDYCPPNAKDLIDEARIHIQDKTFEELKLLAVFTILNKLADLLNNINGSERSDLFIPMTVPNKEPYKTLAKFKSIFNKRNYNKNKIEDILNKYQKFCDLWKE
tara:strand:+ start:553 stop:987 length:435 start_codon:yes stop_codon:yes gene_type:complete